MAVASAGTVNGSKIVLFEDKGQSDILWVTEPASSGHVRIKNVNSGKYLGIEGASKNNGAFLNGHLITVSKTTLLADSLIATGFPYYDYDLLENYINVFKKLMTSTRGMRRLGSAAIDLCFTACGRFDAFFEYSLSPWDVAAGAIILQEAGGKVSDFDGGNNWLHGRQMLASNALLSADLLQVIKARYK